MPLNKNGEIVDSFIKDLELQTNVDNPVIVIKQEGFPVYDISNRRSTQIYQQASTTTGSTTITIASKLSKKFALTSIHVSYDKNAACDVATGTLNVDVFRDGLSIYLMKLYVTTLTAEGNSYNICFNSPLVINSTASGALARISGSFTAGTMNRNIIVTGYWLE